MNKLNTFVFQALDSSDIILYRSKHVSAVSSPTNFDRKETALQYYSSFRAKMAPSATISCLKHRAYKVMNKPQARMALPTSSFFTFVASVHL